MPGIPLFVPETRRAYIETVGNTGLEGTDSLKFFDFLIPGSSSPPKVKVEFDIVNVDTHTFNSIIPKVPVESGVNVFDHITNEPYKVEIEGIFTDTPANPLFFGKALESYKGRAKEAFALLEAVRDKKVEVKVVTGFKVYKHMVFENLVAIRNLQGYAVSFRATFVEVKKVAVDGVSTNFDDVSPDPDLLHQIGGIDPWGIIYVIAFAGLSGRSKVKD